MNDKKLKIGNIELQSNIIIAPMAGISNQAFKKIIKTMGVGLITTEMVNDKALLNKNERTLKMIEIDPGEHPVALQLFGSEISTMVEAAIFLDNHSDCDIIDINMGCPAPKIVKNEAGSKILLDSKKVYTMAKSIKDAVNKPVTVKMRLGWDNEHINIIENCKLLEQAGIDAITIHGRTTKQMYTGKANWELIKEAANSVNIPVIGNGDISSPEMAMEYYNKYEVDGIMIGRAALGNPWIIKRTVEYFKNQVLLPEPTLIEKIEMCQKHLNYLLELKTEKVAIREMRGHAAWYLKGINNATTYKRQIQQANSKEEFLNIFNEILKNFDSKDIHEFN